MAPSTYENQKAWKDIQKFLPQPLAFTDDHSPIEEWWGNRGHTIHLDRWRNPIAKVRVILHHGVGTNGRQMSMIPEVSSHTAGFEVVAVDMPGYGCTKTACHTTVSYDDWVNIANDFINFELEKDDRPIVLYGLSAGGMLTYHVAALNKKVKGIVGMTFLDQRIQAVRDETARDLFMSRVGIPLARLSDLPLFSLLIDPRRDPGLHFLSTYASYKPALEPEEFDVCPILLTQPVKDKWTPLHLSELVLSRVKKVPVKIVELENAGHYPLEDPGLQQMADAIIEFLRELVP
ncbi:hypothetical protein DTO027B5_3627 [Paecilomyces variotii]|nr:hypothetical protein DTO027B3_1536 [Paecilomyces variotii]KAJ9334607.1 hypothetical protein DTO027B5_3627 [Paecilomyces variotii]